MPKYFKITILVLLLAFLIVPHLASAAFIKCGRECVKWSADHSKCVTPGVNPDGTCIPMEEAQPCSICHIFQLLQTLINGFTMALIIWAVFFVLFAGFMILISSGSPEQITKAKRMMGYVVMGLAVGFGGWLFINIIMNTFVQPSALPWPWHQIKCSIPAGPPAEGKCGVSGDGDGGGEEGNICRCELKDESVKTQSYSSAEICKRDCGDWCTTFQYNKFCCLKDASQTCQNASQKDEKKYCICETPLYTVSKTKYPNLYGTLGTEIKGTELSDASSCTAECTLSKAGTYCFSRTLTALSSEANLYCASQNGMEAKQAFCAKLESTNNEIVACFPNQGACAAAMNPDVSEAKQNCITNCFVDGNPNCYCSSGEAASCMSDINKYGLLLGSKEKSVGTFLNAFSCVVNCSSSGGHCRLGASFPTMPKCEGATSGAGACQGASCKSPDNAVKFCSGLSTGCCNSTVNSWNTQIQAAASGRSICSGIDTIKMVKAIMAQESCGIITQVSGAGAAGLMQLLLGTASQFKTQCGASNETIDVAWLTNSDNAQKQICMAIEYLKTLVGSCSCDVRHLAAGYNGGGAALGACAESTNCGSAAAGDGGQCLACSGETFTRRWECLWDDNKHTKCNIDNPSGSFAETRQYAPKVQYCYNRF